jgi:hypothetical protein
MAIAALLELASSTPPTQKWISLIYGAWDTSADKWGVRVVSEKIITERGLVLPAKT